MTSIVFLSVDCLRADHLGCYGHGTSTSPNIDEFATSATVFKHAYANCPGTRWAFQSLHTGVSTHLIDGLGIPPNVTPLAELFSKSGYVTGGFAVNGFTSREYNYHRGFDTYYSVAEETKKKSMIHRLGKKISNAANSDRIDELILKPIHDFLRSWSGENSNRYQPSHTDEDTIDRVLEFIEQQQNAGTDFFCWIHFMDAHTPYGFWPEHLEAVRGDSDIEHTIHPGEEGKITVGDEPPQDVIDTYNACIRSVDEQVGRVLSVLDDETIVILTGDHGEEFGRYNDFHSASLYSTMTQVPMLVRLPSIPVGFDETPVQHLDIPPTLLTAADIAVPDYFEGAPLQTIDRGPDAPIFFTLSDDRMAVRMGEWKLIETNGRQELYNVPHSGQERESVLEDHEDIAQKLQELLEAHRGKPTIGKGASKLSSARNGLSDGIEENLEDLGYL